MTKISNPTKLLLLSLAPLIAHQTTYGMQQQNPPALQQLEPFQLNGVNAPQAVNINIQQQNYLQFVSSQEFQNFLDAIVDNHVTVLKSTVTTAIARWKDALANNLQNQGFQAIGTATFNDQNLANNKLKALRDALYNASLINVADNGGNAAIANLNGYRAQNNDVQANAIKTAIFGLARTIYDLTKTDNEWKDLETLKKAYALIIAEDQINVDGNLTDLANIGVKIPNQNNDQNIAKQQQEKDKAEMAALQHAIKEASNELISTLPYWSRNALMTYTAHTLIQDQNQQPLDDANGKKKFEDFKKAILNEYDGVISMDQFYQFNNVAGINDTALSNLEPEQFMNPNYKNIKTNTTLETIRKLENITAQIIGDKKYITGLEAKITKGEALDKIRQVNVLGMTINKHEAETRRIEKESYDNYLDTNNAWKDNIEQTEKDYETVINAIKAKIKSDTGATDGMIDEFLESTPDPNANDKVIDHINRIVIQDYSKIDTLDKLVDAILTALANVQVNNLNPFTQNALKQRLDNIKLTDTDYFKKSQERIQNQPNQDYNKEVASEIQRIDEFCNNNLGIQIDWNIVKIQTNKLQNNDQANTNFNIVVDAVRATYPKITTDQANTLKLLYLPYTQMQDIVQSNEPQMTLLKTATNNQQLDVTGMGVSDFMSAIRSITNDHFKDSAIDKFNLIDNANGDYIKKQEAPDDENIKTSVKNKLIADGDVINKDANAIAQALAGNQNLTNALKTNDAFQGMFIERSLDAVLRAFNGQIVKKAEFDALQGKLNQKNVEFEQYKRDNTMMSAAQKIVEKKKVNEPGLNTNALMGKVLESVADLPSIGTGQRRMFKVQSNEILKEAGVPQATINNLNPLTNQQEEAITKVLNSQSSYYQIRRHIAGKNIQLAFRTMLAYK